MNAQHHPLREEFVYAGTTLSDNELKTLSPEEIKGWLDQARRALPGAGAQARGERALCGGFFRGAEQPGGNSVRLSAGGG